MWRLRISKAEGRISNKKSQSNFNFRIEIIIELYSKNYKLPSVYKMANKITKYSKWGQLNLPSTFISNFYKPKWA